MAGFEELEERLSRRFGNVGFRVDAIGTQDGGVRVMVLWDVDNPRAPHGEAVAGFLKRLGLPVETESNVFTSLYLPPDLFDQPTGKTNRQENRKMNVNAQAPPFGGASAPPPPPHSATASSRPPAGRRPPAPQRSPAGSRQRRTPSANSRGRSRRLSGAPVTNMHRKWHAMSSLEAIEAKSLEWVNTLTSPGIIKTYIAGMTTLTITFAFVTYVLDIRPSAIFGWHIANTLAASIDWMSPAMIAGLVVLLSILPNLLEFTAGGLAAHGNLMAATAISMSLIFDMITDTPAAYQLGKATVAFFLPTLTGVWFKILSGIVSFPILLFNSFGSEVLLFTFGLTTILLVKRLFALNRRTTTARVRY